MTLDELEQLLLRWGRAYGERPEPIDADGCAIGPRTSGTHPIAAAMAHAPRTRGEAIRLRTTMDRGGIGRRTLMANAANAGLDENRTTGVRVVPGAFVDPIRGRDTRRSHYGMGEISRPVALELQRVEREAVNLFRIDTTRGVCLRVRYCTLGELADKALDASRRLCGAPITVAKLRNEVAFAKVWMHGRLSSP